MNKIIRILTVIAIAQVLLTAITWTGETQLKTQINKSDMFSFNQAEINRIIIKSAKEKVVIIKQDDKWQLADGFEANAKKINSLLGKMAALKFSLPVATSTHALKRFKVSEDDFERYVELKNEDNIIAQLYLGTGAGARKSHVRNGNQAVVYSAAINSYDASANADDWQDKNILQLKKDTVTAIEIDGMKLQRTPDKEYKITDWKANVLPDNQLLNHKAVDESLTMLLSLSFKKILESKTKADYGLEKPVLDLNLEYQNGNRHYLFGKYKETNDYVLKVSDRDEYFQISAFTGKDILEKVSKTKWLIDKPEITSQENKAITPENNEKNDDEETSQSG